MADRIIDIPDLEGELRDLVSESEVFGRRTLFSRGGRPAVVLVSYDEYAALRETVSIAGNQALRGELEAAEDLARKGKLLLPEDLLVE